MVNKWRIFYLIVTERFNDWVREWFKMNDRLIDCTWVIEWLGEWCCDGLTLCARCNQLCCVPCWLCNCVAVHVADRGSGAHTSPHTPSHVAWPPFHRARPLSHTQTCTCTYTSRCTCRGLRISFRVSGLRLMLFVRVQCQRKLLFVHIHIDKNMHMHMHIHIHPHARAQT